MSRVRRRCRECDVDVGCTMRMPRVTCGCREYDVDVDVEGEMERWGAGVETQKNVRGEIGGWGRVPFNETYAPSLSTIYDGA